MESVSSGPKTRKFRCSLFSFATSRRKRPSTCVSPMPRTPGDGHVDRVVAEIRHPQVAQQNAAVGVGIRAHASFALGRKFGQFRFQAALLIEEFLRPVAPQPVFQQLEVFGMSRPGRRAAPGASGRSLQSAGHRPPSVPSSPWVN